MGESQEQRLGNYRVIRLLGRGGFASVYYGEHIYLNTPAAIKMLNVQVASQEHEKFLLEAQIAARLDHPHIISVLEFGIEKQVPYLVMDCAAHGTLRQRYRKGEQLPLAQIVHYAQQIADALQYTHNQHLVHRDVKPENMLLNEKDAVLLSDFGMALVVQNVRPSESNERRIVGTIAYMAPEQLRGEPGPASDQYALGIVIYEWLCGVPPFYGSSAEIAVQHALIPPRPLREYVAGLSPAVEEVVLIALAKEPHRRFGSIKAFANAFTQACASQPEAPITAASDPAPVEQKSNAQALAREKTARRFPRRAAVFALLGGTGLAIGGTLLWKWLLPESKQAGSPPSIAPGTIVYTHHGDMPVNGQTFDWSPDGRRIVLADAGGIEIWEATTGKLDKRYPSGPDISDTRVLWSPDGQHISATQDSFTSTSFPYTVEVATREVVSGKTIATYKPGNNYLVTAIAWSPDSRLLAGGLYLSETGSLPGTIIVVWDALTGKQVSTYQGNDYVNTLAWSPDGKLIASANGGAPDSNEPGFIRVWEVSTGETRVIYRGQSVAVNSVAWSPDGAFLASASGDIDEDFTSSNTNTVQIWQPTSTSEQPLLIYRGHMSPVTSVSWSPKGKIVVSGSTAFEAASTALVQVWNATSGQLVLAYEGHNNLGDGDGVLSLKWSPTGTLIASAGNDGSLQIWQAPSAS